MTLDPCTPQPIEPPLLLTVAEAAAQAKISRSKMYELIASGELDSVTIGRSRRIPTRSLIAFVENRTTSGLS